MKNLIYFLSILSASALIAQPTIQENDVFVVGTSAQYNYRLTPNVTAGNPGPDQTYDMQQENADWSFGYEVMSPPNSPFGPVLPGNKVLVFDNGQSGASYFTKFNGILQLNGMASTDYDNPEILYVEPYSPPMRVASFPMTFGQEFQGNSYHQITFFIGIDLGTGWVTDSMRRRTTEIYNYSIDGWGTLLTPNGQYSVLRQKVTTVTKDSVDFRRADSQEWYLNQELLESENIEYIFWSSEQPFPVARMLDVGADDLIDDCTWITGTVTSLPDLSANNVEVNVFPNPASGFINVSTNANTSALWILFDINGREIKNGKINHNTESLDVKDLANGIYHLKVICNGTSINKKVVIQN